MPTTEELIRVTLDAARAEAGAKRVNRALASIQGETKRVTAEEYARAIAAEKAAAATVRANEKAAAAAERANEKAAAAAVKAAEQAEAARARASEQAAAAAERASERFAKALETIGRKNEIEALGPGLARVTQELRELDALAARATDVGDLGVLSLRRADLESLAAGFSDMGDGAKVAGASLGTVALRGSDLAGASNRAAESAEKLAGAIGVLSPSAANAVRTLGQLAKVGSVAGAATEALGVSLGASVAVLGPLALAVGAAAWAWSDYTERTAAAEAAQKKWEEEAADSLDLTRRLTADLQDAALTQRVYAGEITEVEAAQIRAARSITERFAPDLEKATTKLQDASGAANATRARLAELEKQIADTGAGASVNAQMAGAMSGGLQAARLEAEKLRASLPKLVAEQERAEEAYDKLTGALNELEEREKANIQTEADLAAGKERGTSATRDAADAERDLARARAEAEAQARAYAAALAAVEQAGVAAAEAQMAPLDRLRAQQARALDDLAADYQTAYDAAAGDVERVAALDRAYIVARRDLARQSAAEIAATEAEITAAHAAQADARRKRDEQDAAKRQAELDTFLSAQTAAAAQIASGIGSLAETTAAGTATTITDLQEQLADSDEALTTEQRKALEQRLEDEIEAYREAFKTSKKASLAEIAINGVVAASRAAAALPPPTNVPLIVAAGVTTAAQLAAAAAIQPKFHTGRALGGAGGGGMAAGEQATILRDESVLTSSAARSLGVDRIARANAGQAPAPMEVVIVGSKVPLGGASAGAGPDPAVALMLANPLLGGALLLGRGLARGSRRSGRAART